MAINVASNKSLLMIYLPRLQSGMKFPFMPIGLIDVIRMMIHQCHLLTRFLKP